MMKRLLENKRLQTFALGIGVSAIIIGLGFVY